MKNKTKEDSLENHHELDHYIGKRLREKRLKRGLTLEDLSEKLNLSRQQLQKYETAQSRLSTTILYHLGLLLDVKPSYFFQGYANFQKKAQPPVANIIVPDRQSTLNILLIEDDAADQLLTRRAFEECSVNVNLLAMHDGIAALGFLRNESTSVDFPRPDLILLDLNIPKQDGASVLNELKSDPNLVDIPVIILTNSIDFKEMHSCYKAHAAGYLCKTFDFDVFQNNLDILAQYWALSAVLPNRSQGVSA